jgi:hypothetical protein
LTGDTGARGEVGLGDPSPGTMFCERVDKRACHIDQSTIHGAAHFRRFAMTGRWAMAVVAGLLGSVAAGAEQGEIVQTDNLGMNLVTWNRTKHTTTTVADAQVLSEFVGIQYYFAKDFRLGLTLQFSEQLNPEPTKGDRFRTFALLPQVGWTQGPFFVAGIFTFALRSGGTGQATLGFQLLAGGAVPLSERIKLSLAIEIPYNVYPDQTIGITPLIGLSIRL